MMLSYRFNDQIIRIEESPNGNDVEFRIHIFQNDPYLAEIKKVQRFFEDNRVYTDVLFYALENHRFRVIVRRDYYVDFVLELMKHRLLQSVEWKSE